jgi:ubiquinone/menaquinone biosynthesis C-methylase UbiE
MAQQLHNAWIRRRDAAAVSAAREWDARVQNWEEVAELPVFQRLAERVVELAAPRSNDVVVDLGAGTGLLTLALAARVETVIAVDASPAMLGRLDERARQANAANIKLRVADLRSLPLPDASVTLAVSNYAFHHLDDPGKELALAELRRVLVPGGRLVICDMMFSLSLNEDDRRIVSEKLRLLARQGLPGLARIARNGWRIMRGRWERPAPVGLWQEMLLRRSFADVSVIRLENEAAVAIARRPA